MIVGDYCMSIFYSGGFVWWENGSSGLAGGRIGGWGKGGGALPTAVGVGLWMFCYELNWIGSNQIGLNCVNWFVLNCFVLLCIVLFEVG